MSTMLAAALALIAHGWPVIPCTPGGKKPLTPRGHVNASLDPELVRRWWGQIRNANIAVPCGAATFDVFDVDVKAAGNGWPAFNRLKAAGLLPTPFRVVATPSGGAHFYYAGTGQSCSSLKDHFVDFKAQGGYVLVPPSVVDGRPYRVVTETSQAAAQLNWGEVRRFLTPPVQTVSHVSQVSQRPKARGTGIPHLVEWLATQTEGNRNKALFWAACRCAENGATEAELHDLYARMDFSGKFRRGEAARTVRDAFRITTRRSA
ncbi:DNA primase [Streptosporangium violaceochromogenes]|nr:DNA primase [Streptosporangium violaceochromogenes]